MKIRVRTTHPDTFDYIWSCEEYLVKDNEFISIKHNNFKTYSGWTNVRHDYGPEYSWIVEEVQ